MRLFLLLLISSLLPTTSVAQTMELGIPLGHRSAVSGMRVLSDGTLITSSEANVLYRWDVQERRIIDILTVQRNFGIRVVTKDGILADVVTEDVEVKGRINHVVTGVRTIDLNTHKKTNYAFPFGVSPYRFSLGRDGRHYTFNQRMYKLGEDTASFKRLPTVFTGKGKRTRFTPNGTHLFVLDSIRGVGIMAPFAAIDQPHSVKYEGLQTGSFSWVDNNARESYIFNKSPLQDSTVNWVNLWVEQTGRHLGSLRLPKSAIIIDVHPNDLEVLVRDFAHIGEQTQAVTKKYSLLTGKVLTTYVLPQHDQAVAANLGLPSGAFTLDGDEVLLPGYSGGVFIYNAANGELKDSLVARARPIRELELAPNGEALLIAADHLGEEVSYATWEWRQKNIVTAWPAELKDWGHVFYAFDSIYAEPTVKQVGQADASVDYEQRFGKQFRSDTVSAKQLASVTLTRNEKYEGFNRAIFDITEEFTDGSSRQTHFNYAHRQDDLAYLCAVSVDATTKGEDLVAVGTCDGYVMLFDREANFKKIWRDHLGTVTVIKFSNDGKTLFTGGIDGAIYIYDLSTEQEKIRPLARLFVFNDEDWVVTDNAYRFDASTGAESLLYYKLKDQNGDWETVELEQMKDRFYDPSLLQKLLGFSSVPIRNTDGLEQVALYPEASLSFEDEQLNVRLLPRKGGIGKVAFLIGSKQVNLDVNPQRKHQFSVDLRAYRRFFKPENVLSVITYNQDSTLRSPRFSIVYKPAVITRGRGTTARQTTATKAEVNYDVKLFVLAVGTSDYAEGSDGTTMDLDFPQKDAEQMSLALKAVGCNLFCSYGEVDVTCLTTGPARPAAFADTTIKWKQATKTNILASMDDLKKKARPQDIVVVYLSGHGKTYASNNKNQFHYLTQEVSPSNIDNAAALKNAVLSSEEFTALLTDIPAEKQVLIIDACNAGAAIGDISLDRNVAISQTQALAWMSDRAGLYLLAGSAEDRESFESSKYGQGLLTYALLKGMTNEALRQDENNQFLVGVTELFEFAKKDVHELASKINQVQVPDINYPVNAGSFAIGIYDEEVKELIGKEKRIIGRGSFQNEENFLDDLELERSFSERLRLETGPENESALLYVHSSDFPGAFQVRGRYRQIADGSVVLRANLAQDGEVPIIIPLKGKDNTLDIKGKNAESLSRNLWRALKKVLPE